MRTHSRWLAAALAPALAVAVVAAGAATRTSVAHAESNGGVKVMPLGDSITDGIQTPGGYRIGLWQRFTGAGYKVDFVGSQSNGPAALGDHDHEGHPGWRIDQIDANIVGWLGAYQPHTVLLHIGTNDILQNDNLPGAPGRLSTLIDHITATDPGAEVFVATLIPLASASGEAGVVTFNAAIPGIVQSKTNAGKHVHLVDMHSALTAADLTDGIHPTPAGYDKMAAKWYTALLSTPGTIGQPGSGGGSLTPGSRISVRATTSCCTGDYIRHDDADTKVVLSAITSASTPTAKADATWIVHTGLANNSCLSFESANDTGQYLRHSNFQLYITPNDGTSAFAQDATFCPQSGHNGQGYSFQSNNYPTKYIRHFNYTGYIASNGGTHTWDTTTSWNDDTSWIVTTPWT